jgi:hypothetical protein
MVSAAARHIRHSMFYGLVHAPPGCASCRVPDPAGSRHCEPVHSRLISTYSAGSLNFIAPKYTKQWDELHVTALRETAAQGSCHAATVDIYTYHSYPYIKRILSAGRSKYGRSILSRSGASYCCRAGRAHRIVRPRTHFVSRHSSRTQQRHY